MTAPLCVKRARPSCAYQLARTLPLPEAIAIIQAGQQRCWFQKQANALAALPESAMPVRRRLRDIYTAEDIDNAQVGVKAFELDYGSKYPEAVAKITTWSAGSYRPGRFAELRSCAPPTTGAPSLCTAALTAPRTFCCQ